MRPEDLDRAMEEAFQKIEPKDEAQREKLEGIRARLRESRKGMMASLEELRRISERNPDPSSEERRAITADVQRIGKEKSDGMIRCFHEQADLLERIAAKVKK